ncbi:MAG: glycerol-3-phosphate dehydrogenase/oxidase [Planctomycetaceae bacterium]
MNRNLMISMLAEKTTWDVVVIGGGATGLGAALDAISRGYRTILLEAADFAKGTSSRSTKLIHGGVRYLRSGQIGMVRESLRERTRLLNNAPHIVHPLRFVIPSYRRGSRWYYLAGLKAYDFLAGRDGLRNSCLLSAEQVAQSLPTLSTQGLRGGVAYSDGQFNDARLAISLAQTIVQSGGVVLNYCPVTELILLGNRINGVACRDNESGQVFQVRAKVVVNATGVFADSMMNLDLSESISNRPQVVPSQGSHIVLSRDFLPGNEGLMIPDTDDGRVLFAIPWEGHTLLGTTDHRVEHISLEPKPGRHEIDYLLEHAGRYLVRKPGVSDIQSIFAGLRPLLGQPGGKKSTANLSREHDLHVSPAGLLTVIGGKWTTYRKMGEEVINKAATIGSLPHATSRTATLPLHGSSAVINHSRPDTATLSENDVTAAGIPSLVDEASSRSDLLIPGLPYVKAQVVQAVRQEMARTIEDVLSRRLRALLLNAQAAIDSAPVVAKIMQTELQQTDSWRVQQIRDFTELATSYLPPV